MSRYQKHIIKLGDTMQAIATLYMGDASLWIDLAKANGLNYPYIVDTVEKKQEDPMHLVTFGDTIIIPLETTLADEGMKNTSQKEQDLIAKIALGQDLSAIDFPGYYNKYGGSNHILQLSSNNQGDLSIVSGIENVKQSIIARILTPKGSLPLHPNYGSLVAQLFGRATAPTAQEINNEISKCILSDSRISGAQLSSYTLEATNYTSNWNVSLESMEAQFSFVAEHDSSGNFTIY